MTFKGCSGESLNKLATVYFNEILLKYIVLLEGVMLFPPINFNHKEVPFLWPIYVC